MRSFGHRVINFKQFCALSGKANQSICGKNLFEILKIFAEYFNNALMEQH